jgi:hypothetical protein
MLTASPASATAKKPSRAARALARAVKHDPRIALRPGFIRKAQAVGTDLPLTARLNRITDQAGTTLPSDDAISFAWDQLPSPVLGGQPPAGSTASALTGTFRMLARFGAETSGYGSPGVVELTQGQSASLQGTAVPLLTSGSCAAPGGTVLDSGPLTLTSAATTYGSLDLFGGAYAGTLRLKPSLTATQPAACGGPASYVPRTTPPQPPWPVVLRGAFRLSPALTADGRVRLGVLAVDDARLAQADSHAELHLVCAPASTCSAPSVDLEGRVKALTFTAELLIGT